MFSVVWFTLLKFEVLDTAVPAWVGWVSIAALALWCVVATFQMKLWPTVRESAFPHGEDIRHGLLALRRLLDLLRRLRAAGRARRSSSAGCSRSASRRCSS
jgi:membrane protein YdbS with pleckstrin-like domain